MNDLRFALRQLLKNTGFTVVAVLTTVRLWYRRWSGGSNRQTEPSFHHGLNATYFLAGKHSQAAQKLGRRDGEHALVNTPAARKGMLDSTSNCDPRRCVVWGTTSIKA